MPATAETTHDVVVLGGGSGGYACALRAAQLGLSVALVEKDLLGGTCLHRGCIPTKALLHAAEVADAAREAERFGVRATLTGIDMPGVTAYREGVVGRLHKGLQGLVTASRMDYVEGEGRLEDGTVVVGDRRLVGRHVVLATGSYALTLPGLEIGGRVMTSDEALGLDHVPDRVVVLGGGVIGVEFASVMRSFGAEVTIIEALPRLVAAEEPAVSKALERAFRKRGIVVRAGVRFESAKDDGHTVSVRLDGGDELVADLLLVAVGRGPSTDGLGYAEAGVTLDRGFVVTDERCRTSADGVYAVGDVVPGLQLAHRGFAQGIFVAEDIAGLDPAPILESTIPRVTYSDPEVASVGLTEQQARRGPRGRGTDLRVQPRAGTAGHRSCGRPVSSSSYGSRTGLSSVSTWSGHGSVSRSVRRSSSWGGRPMRRTSRDSSTPTPRRTKPWVKPTWRSPGNPSTHTTRVTNATGHEGELSRCQNA